MTASPTSALARVDLPAAGRPEQHRGAPPEESGELGEAVAVQGADGEHGHAGRGGLHVLHEVRQPRRVGHQVGLGQHDHGLRPGLPGERQEPFDAAEVEFHGQGDGDHGVVDVGGEDLRLGPLGGGGAQEGGTARQQRPYVARVGARGVDGGPVAGAHDLRGVAGHHELGVGADDALGRDEVAHPAVDAHDAPGHQSFGGVRRERRVPAVVPAVRGQRRRGGEGRGRGGGRRGGRRRGGGRRRERGRQGGPFTGAVPAARSGARKAEVVSR